MSEWISLVLAIPTLGQWVTSGDVRDVLRVRADATAEELRTAGFPDVAARVEALKAAEVNGDRREEAASPQPAGAAAAPTGIPAGGQFGSGGPPAGLRMFPILGPMWAPREVPWYLVEPHRRQALANHHQTLERLAERGGLDPTELVAVLEDRPWQTMTQVDAVARLGVLAVARLGALVGRSGS